MSHQRLLRDLLDAVNGVIRGKEDVVLNALTAAIAGGHVLLEDVPGVGKTTMAHALARALGCTFRRIQFTSDLLPSDILGVNVFVRSSETFEFRAGPVFANVVLADEINRTTPKTQSSLLEAMNEGQVSIDDVTHKLPDPFIVLATQNPQDFHGTYPLPESQLDRFMMRLHLGYPDARVERAILKGRNRLDALSELEPRGTVDQLRELQRLVDDIRVDDLVIDYLMTLVETSRQTPSISLGVSTRGALALQRAARARALLLGRSYCLPDDVKHLAVPVLAHRIQVTGGGEGLLRTHGEAERVIAQLLEQVPVPV